MNSNCRSPSPKRGSKDPLPLLDILEAVSSIPRGLKEERTNELIREDVSSCFNMAQVRCLGAEDSLPLQEQQSSVRVSDIIYPKKAGRTGNSSGSKPLTTLGISNKRHFERKVQYLIRKKFSHYRTNRLSYLNENLNMRGTPDGFMMIKGTKRTLGKKIAVPVEIKCSKYFKTKESFWKRIRGGKSFLKEDKGGALVVKEKSRAFIQMKYYSAIFCVPYSLMAIQIGQEPMLIKVFLKNKED